MGKLSEAEGSECLKGRHRNNIHILLYAIYYLPTERFGGEIYGIGMIILRERKKQELIDYFIMQHILTTAIEKILSGSILVPCLPSLRHTCALSYLPLKVSILIQSAVSVIVCRYTSGGPRNPNTAVNHFTCSLFTEQCSLFSL